MHQLKLASIFEKNKISNTTAFIILLEIIIPGIVGNIRICYNNADIDWNGYTWIAFPFELGEITESKTELPSLTLKVSNINKVISRYLEETSGGAGASVIIRVVNTANLDATEPDLEETLSIESATVDAHNVTFKLGAETAATLRRPFGIYQGRHCRFKFRSVQCGYNGDETTCNKTKERCEALDNVERFGAEVGVSGKLYS